MLQFNFHLHAGVDEEIIFIKMKIVTNDFSALNPAHILMFYIVMNNLCEIKHTGASSSPESSMTSDNNREYIDSSRASIVDFLNKIS